METETLTTVGLPVSSEFRGLASLPVGTRVRDCMGDEWETGDHGLVTVWDDPANPDYLMGWAEVRASYRHCVRNDWDVLPAAPEAAASEVDPHTDWALTPDALACWERDMLGKSDLDQSTVAHEAQTLVYGDRNDGYGHPRDNMTRIAHMWTALLSGKLAEGEWIAPEDVARAMVAVKLSRDVSAPKRDNRVDGIGYLIALDRLETGR